MSYVKYTKTSTFLFPLLEIPKALFACHIKNSFDQVIMTTRFLNSYLYDVDLEHLEYNEGPYVYLVIKSYQDVEFDTFYSTILSFKNYIDEYEKGGYIIMIFKIPDKNLDDYNKVKEGLYSILSKEAKTLIMQNAFFSGKHYIIPLILNKSENLKESWEKKLSNDGIVNGRFVGMSSMADLADQEVWPIIITTKESLTKEILIELKQSKLLSVKEIEE